MAAPSVFLYPIIHGYIKAECMPKPAATRQAFDSNELRRKCAVHNHARRSGFATYWLIASPEKVQNGSRVTPMENGSALARHYSRRMPVA
jgi:hypothetical protein